MIIEERQGTIRTVLLCLLFMIMALSPTRAQVSSSLAPWADFRLSPDGTRLLFVQRLGSETLLKLKDLTEPTDSARLVAQFDETLHALLWTKDGQRILCVYNEDGAKELGEIRVDSDNQVSAISDQAKERDFDLYLKEYGKMTEQLHFASPPAMRFDSLHIARSLGGVDIYIMDHSEDQRKLLLDCQEKGGARQVYFFDRRTKELLLQYTWDKKDVVVEEAAIEELVIEEEKENLPDKAADMEKDADLVPEVGDSGQKSALEQKESSEAFKEQASEIESPESAITSEEEAEMPDSQEPVDLEIEASMQIESAGLVSEFSEKEKELRSFPSLPDSLLLETAEYDLPKPVYVPKEGQYRYTFSLQSGAETVLTEIDREVRFEKGHWVVTDTSYAGPSRIVDVCRLRKGILRPASRELHQGEVQVGLEYQENQVVGRLYAQGREQEMQAPLEHPVYCDSGGLDLTLGSLPLEEGYTAMFRVYDMQSSQIRQFHLEVLNEETCEVAAGEFATFRILIRSLDPEVGNQLLWINSEEGRFVVKSEILIPAAGMASMELQQVK